MSAPAETDRFTVKATADSHFSWIRTRLSLERTMMSWIRTAVALIGFGFTIVQFLVRLGQMPGAIAARHPYAARDLGLALIGCGIVALLIGIWQYLWSVRYLWSGSFNEIAGLRKEGMHSPVLAVAGLLILIGLFAFFAILLRLE